MDRLLFLKIRIKLKIYSIPFNSSFFFPGETEKHFPVVVVFFLLFLQYYKLKYEQQKKEYAETRREFLDQLGDKEAQKKYLDSVKDYVKKKNEFMKYWKLKSGSNPKNLVRLSREVSTVVNSRPSLT